MEFLQDDKINFMDFSDLKTKQGIDKVMLILFFIPVLEAKSSKVCGKAIIRLKLFLVQQLKRGISDKEEVALLEGCKKYIMSDAATNERTESMNYLFELKFLND